MILAATADDGIVRAFFNHPIAFLAILILVWNAANPLIRTVIFYVLVRAAVRRFSTRGDRSRFHGWWRESIGIFRDTWLSLRASFAFIVLIRETPLFELFRELFQDSGVQDRYVEQCAAIERKRTIHGELTAVGAVSGAARGERIARDVVDDLADMYRDVVTFGPTMGIIERSLVFVMAYYHQFEAIAVTFAFKGLIAQLIGGGGFPKLLPDLPLKLTARRSAGTTDAGNGPAGAVAFAPDLDLELASGGTLPAPTLRPNHGPLDMYFFEKETYLLGSLLSFLLGTLGGLAALAWVDYSRPSSEPPRVVASAAPAPESSKPTPMSERNRTPVLLDLDTGVDDALALLLVLHCPELEIVGISTVSGNITAEQARLNTNFILRQFDVAVDWKVRAGESKSLAGRLPQSVPHIHGEDGLGGLRAPGGDSPEEIAPEKTNGLSRGVELILKHARASHGKLKIVATGPLTNIARALEADPEAMGQVDALYVMGGAFDDPTGNITPHAEFNVHCDPEAYDVVLKSQIPITLFPLDVTEKVKMKYAELNDGLKVPAPTLRLLRDLTRIYAGFHHQTAKFDGCYMHDVHPVAALIHPDLFEFRRSAVEVELADQERRGKLSWAKTPKGGRTVKVAERVDSDAFLRFYWNRLRSDSPACRY